MRDRGRETNSGSKLDLLNGNFVEEWLPSGILFLLRLVSNVWQSSSLVTFGKLFMWLKVVSAQVVFYFSSESISFF